MTLYQIKPFFQSLLRPLVRKLAANGINANQVTLSAAIGSSIVGAMLCWLHHISLLFLLLPIWMLLRMALNAIDGMLAREYAQQSRLGACLNEMCDVISDAILYLPFALVAPFSFSLQIFIIFLALLTEYAGLLGPSIQAHRRYDGPMGKSDRALFFALIGFCIAIFGTLPDWTYWLQIGLVPLLVLTVVNRIKNALREATIT